MLNLFSKIFGTQNNKEIKKYYKRIQSINNLESKYKLLSNEQLKDRFYELKKMVRSNTLTLDEAVNDCFAIVRESSHRILGMRHYDVQLIGGLVLHEGKIAEMKTGEGKTLVGTLAVSLNALNGKGVHVVTVNDYLASRDAIELEPLYNFLGFSVSSLTSNVEDNESRKEKYNADITYGTNNEFGFDFLRDNMSYELEDKVQRDHNFVIIDEVDSILIDEARTPLIISGPTNHKSENYIKANKVALHLTKGTREEASNPMEDAIVTGDFSVDEKNKVVLLNESGIIKAEKLFGIDSMYSIDNANLSHHLDQALKANYIFEKDVDYVVQNNEIIIVDEFTGRLSEGRRFSDGLHQALEAKENVEIKEDSQTLADITFQNYFRMYDKLAGMTGTAQTEATEFSEIYSLDVISIPTNLPVTRNDKNDLIFRTENEKFNAVCQKIKKVNKLGQPILVGTASIEKSEHLHELLKKEKIKHTILNAKQHEKEGEIIKDAGLKGAVTIATSMAGRGVDIKLPQECKELGGLLIIGTERHESRRIDNQLRGRSGRQGDVGESQFFLSLEDNLLRIFGSDKISGVMKRLGLKEGEHIESGMVTRAVENAQKKVETMHFESRKHLLEYDDVANQQRKVIYNFRNNLLDKDFDISTKLNENINEYIANLLHECDFIDGMPIENMNFKKISLKLLEELNIKIEQTDIRLDTVDQINQKLITILTTIYTNKMKKVSNEQQNEIQRVLYLQILDDAWREHLYSMDTLKTGIGLRGYNQKDPLVEYKKESYNMFIELISSIKNEIIKFLFTIQLQNQKETELQRVKEQMKFDNGNITLGHEVSKPNISKKIARNSSCPCGSNKKYKQCCGKSGPKKGLVAH
ncbi:Protein export cytoplasm protein SecA ATPase RNA helicase (TC 3.A.5.1.1) [hydrothermal vent metagenome]|uniref:Protein export cytoplasm protein SecA ATPase RNA helicase (TC 3.A.5.1.1) n=1 Tax=hydrothermal vent metagenome TaxID=652676 RepID=A0A3B1E7J3_9ZZZZ